MQKPTSLVLFDIDGTLVDCKGLGTRSFLDAGKRVFGDGFQTNNISFAGGVDNALLAAIAKEMNVELTKEKLARFREDYNQSLSAALSGQNIALKGAQQAIQHASEKHDVSVGVLTGNFKVSAATKLRAAGVDIDLALGAYGDDAHLRADLVPIAIQRAQDIKLAKFSAEKVTIIGDTPADIACARAHGCRSIALCTGSFDAAQLSDAHHVFSDLPAMLKSSWI